MKTVPLLTVLAGVALLGASAHGQVTIDWFTLDGGGGAQASAHYLVNSTIGQTDAGPAAQVTSANYRITPGFWALEDMGPADPRPELSIRVQGNSVVLSWPSPSAGFGLQQTESFNSMPAAWSNSAVVVSDDGVVRSVTLPLNEARRFYRLQKP
jgi:hypothetical protein